MHKTLVVYLKVPVFFHRKRKNIKLQMQSWKNFNIGPKTLFNSPGPHSRPTAQFFLEGLVINLFNFFQLVTFFLPQIAWKKNHGPREQSWTGYDCAINQYQTRGFKIMTAFWGYFKGKKKYRKSLPFLNFNSQFFSSSPPLVLFLYSRAASVISQIS